jgi:hypothetical protein
MDLLWPVIDAVAVIALIAVLWWLRDNITHNERQIIIALIGIGIAIFFAHRPLGLWKALGITFLWEYGIVGFFFALLFTIVGIGKGIQRLKGKGFPDKKG